MEKFLKNPKIQILLLSIVALTIFSLGIFLMSIIFLEGFGNWFGF